MMILLVVLKDRYFLYIHKAGGKPSGFYQQFPVVV